MVYTAGQALNWNGAKVEVRGTDSPGICQLKAVLEAAGTGLENVVKATFITDMEKFGDVNRVYGQYFTGDFPARSCIEVGRLPKDALVEIEVVAAL